MADVTISGLDSLSVSSGLLLPVSTADGSNTGKVTIANVNSLAPVQSVFGRTGNVVLQSSADIPSGIITAPKLDGGQTGSAPIFGIRVWVNFNGYVNTVNSNLLGTYSQSGTTVTVTATNHNLQVGHGIYSVFSSGTGVAGIYIVTSVINSNSFTYTAGTSLTTSGNITLRRNSIRASGNVSSVSYNGTADHTINFTTPLIDTNYAISGSLGTDANANILIPVEQGTNRLRVWGWDESTSSRWDDSSLFSVIIVR